MSRDLTFKHSSTISTLNNDVSLLNSSVNSLKHKSISYVNMVDIYGTTFDIEPSRFANNDYAPFLIMLIGTDIETTYNINVPNASALASYNDILDFYVCIRDNATVNINFGTNTTLMNNDGSNSITKTRTTLTGDILLHFQIIQIADDNFIIHQLAN